MIPGKRRKAGRLRDARKHRMVRRLLTGRLLAAYRTYELATRDLAAALREIREYCDGRAGRCSVPAE
jgi:hypothetical protein